MEPRQFGEIDEIGRDAWERLAPRNFPFASFDYLRALEMSGVVGKDSGWLPVYLGVEHEDSLVGLSYLYVKDNSYGEYIFDWSWAQAFQRHGLPYYPKLTSAVPFTPATGPKLLIEPSAVARDVAAVLIRQAKELVAKGGMSSLHYLFLAPEEAPLFEASGMMLRHSFQYHWKNRDYRSFADFLAELRPKKSRQIRREREQLKEAGLEIELLTGESLYPEHAAIFYRFYLATIEKMGAIPYLNLDFFRLVFDTMRDRVVLLLAKDRGEAIAGSLFYRQGAHLYGRYWGASKDVRNLHFELCYYRAIEWAIGEGITLFEAGAQGEHKVARGFLPELTYSAHAITHPAFSQAIDQFVAEEKADIARLFTQMTDGSPYVSG